MIACTIAGSDSGGGAGIQADIKTFQELGVFGTSVITALTAQSTTGVYGVEAVTPAFVAQQLTVLLDDFNIRAMKTGMLANADVIAALEPLLARVEMPLIVDPVMVAKGGQSLLQHDAVEAFKAMVLPHATICTPNIPEAEVLTGMKIESASHIERAAVKLLSYGIETVIIKGGHLNGDMATDTVYSRHEEPFVVEAARANTTQTHGTGCTFSAAITACIAKGIGVKQAITEAKQFIDAAIKHPLHIGHGFGPTNHFAYRGKEGPHIVERS